MLLVGWAQVPLIRATKIEIGESKLNEPRDLDFRRLVIQEVKLESSDS